MPASTWIRFAPTLRDVRPVRLVHVPAMWPFSPRHVRASSQCEITPRSCHAVGGFRRTRRSRNSGNGCGVQRRPQILDRPRSRVTAVGAGPRLGLAQECSKLRDQLSRRSAVAVERLDALEPLEDGSRLVHRRPR